MVKLITGLSGKIPPSTGNTSVKTLGRQKVLWVQGTVQKPGWLRLGEQEATERYGPKDKG